MLIIIITMILTLIIFYPILRMSSICSREEENWEMINKEKNKAKESE